VVSARSVAETVPSWRLSAVRSTTVGALLVTGGPTEHARSSSWSSIVAPTGTLTPWPLSASVYTYGVTVTGSTDTGGMVVEVVGVLGCGPLDGDGVVGGGATMVATGGCVPGPGTVPVGDEPDPGVVVAGVPPEPPEPPEPEPRPDPDPEPEPDPDPPPRPEPDSKSPDPDPDPEPAPEPAPGPDLDPLPNPDPAPDPEPASNPDEDDRGEGDEG
jgi:hypothetical protein